VSNSMNIPKIAIFSPNIGERSETFIRRHIEDLYPGRVVAVTFRQRVKTARSWDLSCPTRTVLDLSFEGSRIGRRLGLLIPLKLLELYYQQAVFDWLKAQNVTVMLGQYLHQSWPFIRLASKNGIRFFAHAHGYDLSQIWAQPRWRRRYADYRNSAGVIVVNEIMKQRMMSVGLPVQLIHNVPYGVDIPNATPQPERSDTCKFLAVGRMVGKKAPILTLSAFQIAQRICPGLRLNFVGSGPLFGDVEKFVFEQGLQSSVTLHGGKSHEFVLDLMKSSRVFVQHSVVNPITLDEEGVPVAILEAMAHGVPIISTTHAGIPEAVQDGVSGILVKEGDVQAMAEAMVRLAGDPALISAMGQAARKSALERFSWETEREKLLEILDLDR